MLTFKTTQDLTQLSTDHPAHHIIKTRLPDLNGYIVLIETGDTHIDLPELRGKLIDIAWEGVMKSAGHYIAVYLTNNEFTLEFLISANTDDALMQSLEALATN